MFDLEKSMEHVHLVRHESTVASDIISGMTHCLLRYVKKLPKQEAILFGFTESIQVTREPTESTCTHCNRNFIDWENDRPF